MEFYAQQHENSVIKGIVEEAMKRLKEVTRKKPEPPPAAAPETLAVVPVAVVPPVAPAAPETPAVAPEVAPAPIPETVVSEVAPAAAAETLAMVPVAVVPPVAPAAPETPAVVPEPEPVAPAQPLTLTEPMEPIDFGAFGFARTKKLVIPKRSK